MVVGEGTAFRQDDARPLQSGEEFFRRGDAGKGQDPPAGMRGDLRTGKEARPQDRQFGRQQIQRAGLVRADQDRRLTAGGAGGDRFAQRPGRHDPAVAEAEGAVDRQQREGLLQGRVLQAVIHHQRLRSRRQGRARTGGTIGADPGGRDRREQQGLVADKTDGIVPVYPMHAARRPAIAAQKHVHGDASCGQPGGDIERQGSFARAADRDVAAADHRHRRPPARLRHPPRGAGGDDRANGGEQGGQQQAVAVPPEAGGARHQAAPRPASTAAVRAGRSA